MRIKLESIISKWIFIIFPIFLISCNEPKSKTQVDKRDLNYKWVSLHESEIDSIYNSNLDQIVFLSFYPGMHNAIFKRQLKIERDNWNLSHGTTSYTLNNIGSKTLSTEGEFELSLKFSVEDYYVNLKNDGFIDFDTQDMVLNLYYEKYGKPKDTIIDEVEYLLFKDDKKYVTFNLDDEHKIDIKYWSKKSLQKLMNDKRMIEERNSNFIEIEEEKSLNQI